MTPERERPAEEERLSQLALILARRFILRWDVTARQLADGRYVARHEPLNAELLLAHLRGDVTLGAYLLNKHSQGRCLVLDADDGQTWEQLQSAAQRLQREGVPSYLEASRRGGHHWFFFERLLAGKAIRRFARGVLAICEIGAVEIFPKQDRLSTGPGSLIRLPFGLHQRSGKRYGFCTPDSAPLAPTISMQIERLSRPQTVSQTQLASYSRYGKETPETGPRATPELPSQVVTYDDTEQMPLSERIKEAITVRAFIERYAPEVQLNEKGIGYCPFHDDKVQSFGVDAERNFWNCFAGCGSGSVIDFRMAWRKREGLDDSFGVTLKDLAAMLL